MTRHHGPSPLTRLLLPLLAVAPLLLAGCPTTPTESNSAGPTGAVSGGDAKIQAARAKLSPEDRALVEAQEWCVQSDGRLGSMGTPIKVMVKDQPVFVCCNSCVEEAKADPEKTLAKVEKLKKKKASQKQ